ncbi:unnamed protein product [Zymoseptoria tritici ST99CH_1A5]|uniref:DUF6589 domain-containing protein n=1 Tax=Zymoseptoria tritici ST99CH_1A5 TaxID=1276529 RepID=A0A1Y6LGS4_ZYMTR|nr:unnamed protein product [Zymoseptoria tritici ST99CH_1A5]
MRRRRLISSYRSNHAGLTDINVVREALQHLSPRRYVSILSDIYQQILAPEAWAAQGKDPDLVRFSPESNQPSPEATPDDTNTRSAATLALTRRMHITELWMTLRQATRRMDIGHVDRCLEQLAIVFFGAGQSNYGREMLYFRWLLLNSAPVLQRALLACGFVNMAGRYGKGLAVDELLELENGRYQNEIKAHKNSTHDVDAIFIKVALSTKATAKQHASLKEEFGTKNSGGHSYKDTSHDT